ncbi:hypothetical protein CXB51_026178 [Gossypium anomalum]|uniref:DUF7745 domain-containing protein n=1 Tax=Gossypium anomalum TaxID=47600 RepID=A0A8J6CS32_9ROSI|nr:hypothetical protein CXB51_026178 [Gossypium anomalum]
MGNEYLDKVEDNASACTWSEKTQLEKGDSVTEGHTSEQLFYQKLWRSALFARHQGLLAFNIYEEVGNDITGMSEQWAVARVQQKGDSKCVLWAVLRDLISTHPDVKKRVDVLALSIYGLVIFPKALGHIDEEIANLFDRLGKQNTPVPAILAKAFRSLSACRRAGEGRFIGCAQLLIFERKMLCGRLLGWFLVKSFTAMVVLIESLCQEFGKLLDMHHCFSKAISSEAVHTGYTGFRLDVNLEYKGWFSRRVNDNVPSPILGMARSLEESLRVIPSIIRGELTSDSIRVGGYESRVQEKEFGA